MEGGEESGRQDGDDRGHRDTGEIDRQAQRQRAGPHLTAAVPDHHLVAGHQGDHRREGHLEAGRQEDIGCHEKNRQSGPADQAQGDRHPIDHDCQQDQAYHQEGPLGRHRAAASMR